MNLLRFFSSLFGYILDFLKRTYTNYKFFSELRKQNPTCTFRKCSVNEVEFSENNVIHTNVLLKKVYIGSYSYVSSHSVLKNVKIGKFCAIGTSVQIGLAAHPTEKFVSTYPAFFSKNNTGCLVQFREDTIFDESVSETVVENDVWIGSNVIIPGGICIGNGAIIAAGAVVTKNVPPYAIVGGVPARIIKYRFTEDEIYSLKKINWWDWPVEELKENVNLFSNIEDFLDFNLSEINNK